MRGTGGCESMLFLMIHASSDEYISCIKTGRSSGAAPCTITPKADTLPSCGISLSVGILDNDSTPVYPHTANLFLPQPALGICTQLPKRSTETEWEL